MGEYELYIRGLYEEGLRPRDVSKIEGGNRTELELIYDTWLEDKKSNIKEGSIVACGFNFEGYKNMIVEGEVEKILDHAAIIKTDNAYINENLKGRIAVPIKELVTI